MKNGGSVVHLTSFNMGISPKNVVLSMIIRFSDDQIWDLSMIVDKNWDVSIETW